MFIIFVKFVKCQVFALAFYILTFKFLHNIQTLINAIIIEPFI